MAATCMVLSGCASVNDVLVAKESGKEGLTHEYAITQDQAWDIARTVFRWEGADGIEEHRTEGYMLTSSGVSLASSGSVMGAWVENGADGKVKVTVVTKRRVKTDLFIPLSEEGFHRRFTQAVAIVKSGQKLPLTSPAS
ncbi:hypothetical protein H8K32_13750 [Undibacterium jejuense]|uniref:Uncharacterized protein n=2 Tax=Oxalobacteraceae TaxID=75682 RepID=A0A923HHM8_9BURK|nr:hypothetical protein [Undibacterium jejuense]